MATAGTAAQDSSSDYANSSGSDGKPDISWPIERPIQTGEFTQRLEEEVRRKSDTTATAVAGTTKPTLPFEELFPGHKRSQSGIAVRSFLLGCTFLSSILVYVYLAFEKESRLWRPVFFLAALSLFHFLEFWTHARYNLPNATISSFLLFTNGIAYNAAHTTAMLETIFTSIFFHKWQDHFGYLWVQLLGLTLVIIGQVCRTAAMVTAGTNFHHFVQTKQREGHRLVTHGIYAYLRHPSYFGFFWWAVGTQLVIGNCFCFFLYCIILWRFFFRRIKGNDELVMILWEYWKLTGISGRKASHQVLRRRLCPVSREDDDRDTVHLVKVGDHCEMADMSAHESVSLRLPRSYIDALDGYRVKKVRSVKSENKDPPLDTLGQAGRFVKSKRHIYALRKPRWYVEALDGYLRAKRRRELVRKYGWDRDPLARRLASLPKQPALEPAAGAYNLASEWDQKLLGGIDGQLSLLPATRIIAIDWAYQSVRTQRARVE